jgi:hypothetical protein
MGLCVNLFIGGTFRVGLHVHSGNPSSREKLLFIALSPEFIIRVTICSALNNVGNHDGGDDDSFRAPHDLNVCSNQ